MNIAFGSASLTRPSTVMASGSWRRGRSSTTAVPGVAGRAGLRYAGFLAKEHPPLDDDDSESRQMDQQNAAQSETHEALLVAIVYHSSSAVLAPMSRKP